MADALTDRQRQVLELFVVAVRTAMPWPTYRDIGEQLGFTSTHAAHCHVHVLIRKGWLEKPNRRARAFVLSDHSRKVYGLPARAA